MTKTKHALVTQDHCDLAILIWDELHKSGKWNDQIEDLAKLLADHAAEVERKARLDEHDRICPDCSYVRVNGSGGLTQRCLRGAELGGTND